MDNRKLIYSEVECNMALDFIDFLRTSFISSQKSLEANLQWQEWAILNKN